MTALYDRYVPGVTFTGRVSRGENIPGQMAYTEGYPKPRPETRKPKTEIHDPQPETRTPEAQTLNP